MSNEKKLVGTPTGKKTRVGRTVYKTKDGRNVSEIGVSIPLNKEKTRWLNAPSIYNGKQYNEDQVLKMWEAGKIKKNEWKIIKGTQKDAKEKSQERSRGLMKRKRGLMKRKRGGYIGVGKALRGWGIVRKA